MLVFLISCAFVSESEMKMRLDPDGDGISIVDDCDSSTASIGERQVWYEDADGDGYGATEKQESFCSDPGEGWSMNNLDCDDAQASIHPLSIEVCDGIDNDCNDEVDEGEGPGINGAIYFLDADGDGVGTEDVIKEACSLPEGYSSLFGDCDDQSPYTNIGVAYREEDLSLCMTDVDGDGYGAMEAPLFGASGNDCNDTDSVIYPFAPEVVADGVDQNCDALELCFLDEDGDGFGSSNTILGTQTVSSDPSSPSFSFCDSVGMVKNQDDCDDVAANIFPGVAWLDSPTLCMRDADQDGFGDSVAPEQGHSGSDCDDNDSSFHPNAYEVIADGIDQNCDGVDECYFDGDGDGYGVLSTYLDILGIPASTIDCTGVNESINYLDCDDGSILSSPIATEVVGDEIDQNCDGMELCYFDFDQDGFSTGATVLSENILCTDTKEVSNAYPIDCDDYDEFTFPGAALLDSSTACMHDGDGDGYGDSSSVSPIIPGNDCDDNNSLLSPFAIEVCDNIDNDCDAMVDDADPNLDTTTAQTWFEDADGDGYGVSSISDISCIPPEGYVDNSEDCDDGDAAIHPQTSWFFDADEDGFGDPQLSTTMCSPPAGYVLNSEDCDDGESLIYPNQLETCDGIDNNCDALVDEEDAQLIGNTYYVDLDLDGYGDPNNSVELCSVLSGFSQSSGDCDDTNFQINPGATELVGDGVDQNCDGEEICFVDADGDSYPSTLTIISSDTTCSSSGLTTEAYAEDCNDGDSTIHPMAEEQVGGVDYNCDGFESIDDSCYSSYDGSTYFLYCTNPVGWTAARENCENMGYDLTSIRSSSENTHIMDFLTETSWIGYKDTDKSRCFFYQENVLFEWTDGFVGFYQENMSQCGGNDSSGYHNWDEGTTNAGPEPNNYNNAENCVEIHAEVGQYNQSIGTWNDNQCGLEKAYICSIRE